MDKTNYDIKLIALDIDGTLLKNDHTLSERNLAVLKKALAAGVQIVLATGKTRTATESLLKTLALKTPMVAIQGLIVFNADGSIQHQSTLEKQVLRRVVQYAELNGYDVIAYNGNRLLVKRLAPHLSAITKYHEPEPEAVGSLLNVIGSTPINKLVLLGADIRKMKALRWQLEQQVGDQVSFTTTAMLDSLEVLPKGASKGNGLRLLLKGMHVDPAKVMAIGDAENDIEMLKLVGLGVAVGNASEQVKSVAKFVVASNEDDGVAEAIERFVLPSEPKVEEKPVEVKAEAPQTESSAANSASETSVEAKEERKPE